MASAILEGMLQKNLIPASQVAFTRRDKEAAFETEKSWGITYCSLETLLATCDVIVLGIKPQGLAHLEGQLTSFKNSYSDLYQKQPNVSSIHWVSLLAGTPIHKLESVLGAPPIIRVMPNTPCLVHQGMTALCHNTQADTMVIEWISTIFSALGKVTHLDESHFDLVTALSGSGPAFFYRLANAMSQKGVELGLDKHQCLDLITQTMKGASAMLAHGSDDPQHLIDQVTSPGGTTEAGLKLFDIAQLDATIGQVIQAAYDRSKELSGS